ncbi:hypothetical protein F5Y18DRAFT_262979 [Xylariaceae sp. FL1019]|nr:hypothetical protein F5Y18DRAFT_262979 [Xylariaceae sp. FL1019]
MASEGGNCRFFRPLNYNLDSQESTQIESGLIGLLGDSQETQDTQESQVFGNTQLTDISPLRFDRHADNHADTSEPTEDAAPSQPFIGRPKSDTVDDIHTGFGFQFANASVPREGFQRPKQPPRSIEPQRFVITAKDHVDGSDSLPQASRSVKNESPRHMTRNQEKNASQDRAAAGGDTGEENYALVSSDSSSDKAGDAGIWQSEHYTGAHGEHPLKSQLKMTVSSAAHSHQANGRKSSKVQASNLHDPAQSEPPLRSNGLPEFPFKEISTPATRSPAGFPKSKKLPKAYSNIQRKAHIQMSPLAGRLASRRRSPKARTGESSTARCSKKKYTEHDSTARAASPARSTPTIEHQYPDSHTGDLAHYSGEEFRGYSSPHGQQLPETLSEMSIAQMDVNTAMQSRPTSQVSNISRKRVSRSQRNNSKSTRDHPSPNLQECQTKQSELAQAWNNHFGYSIKLNKHYEAKLAMMTKQITAQNATIGQYVEQIQKKDQSISQLANDNRDAIARCEEQSTQLMKTKKKQERMQEKLHEYKNHLNEATREQQKIFTYCRSKYQQTIEEVKLEEQQQRDSLEKALKSSENVRQEVQKMVSDVKAISLQEIQQLNLRIECLRVELSEREKDVNSEKDRVLDLREELLENRRMTGEALKSLGEQQQQLLELGLQAKSDTQDMKKHVERQDQNIMAVMKTVEDNQEVTENSSQLIDELRKQQNHALETVLSEFREHVASSSEISSSTAEGFKADISTIRDLCNNLKTLFQSEAGWKEKYEQASRDCRSLSDHLRQQEDELREASLAADQQHIQCRELSDELQALTEGSVPLSELDDQVYALQHDNQRLRQVLDEQTQSSLHADERLRTTNEELIRYRNQAQTQDEQIQTDRANHRQQLKHYRTERERAIKQAIDDEAERCRAKSERLEQRLRESEENRNRLEEELSRAREAAEHALRNGDFEDNAAMRDTLDNTTALMQRFLDDMQGAERSRDDLKAMFEKWSNGHIELGLLRADVRKLSTNKAAVAETKAQFSERLAVQRNMEDMTNKQRLAVESVKKLAKNRGQAVSSNRIEHQVDDADFLAPDASIEEVRRVSIKSPANEAGIDMPLSVDEERDMRRFGSTPKSIMKQGSDETQLHEQAQGEMTSHAEAQIAPEDTTAPTKRRRKTVKRTKSIHFSRSAYNRPVMGSTSNDVESADEISRPSEPGSPMREGKRKISQQEEDPIESVDEGPPMRRRRKLSRALLDSVPANVRPETHAQTEEEAPEPILSKRRRDTPQGNPRKKSTTYESQPDRAIQNTSTPQPSSSGVSKNHPSDLDPSVPVGLASRLSSVSNVSDDYFLPLGMGIP